MSHGHKIIQLQLVLNTLTIPQDQHLQDWLFYRTICGMPKKAGLQNTDRPIK